MQFLYLRTQSLFCVAVLQQHFGDTLAHDAFMVNNETRQLLRLFLLLKEGSQFIVYSIDLFTFLRHLPILHKKATKLDVKSLAITVYLCARFLDHVQLAFFAIQSHVPNHSVFRRISQLASYALQLIVAIHLLLSRLFLFLQFC